MRVILYSAIFLMTILQSFGQDSRIASGFTIEPFVGYSQSTFIDGNVPMAAYLRTYSLGVIGNYYFNDTWSIRSGIVKDRMGGSLFGIRVTSPQGTVFLSSKVLEQEFVSFPIQANWHFGKRKRWNLAFGVSYALAIGDKLEFGDQEYTSFVGGAIDIGYRYPLGPGHLVIRSSALVRSENDTSIYSGQRRSSISLGYAYGF